MQESNKVANANKFTPKPGDKIICNNGAEFICCTLGFLREEIYEGLKSDKPILGYRKFGYEEEWQHWDEDGYASLAPDDDYNIREVIPQSVGAAEKKEEVKEDSRYTLQEIKEAWKASGWIVATSSWNTFQKNITKINSPEYQEYLRLKAIYE